MADFDLGLVTACKRGGKKVLRSAEEKQAGNVTEYVMGVSGLSALLYKGLWHQRSIITAFYLGLGYFKQPAQLLIEHTQHQPTFQISPLSLIDCT